MENKKIKVAIMGTSNLGKSCINQMEKRNDEFEVSEAFSLRDSFDENGKVTDKYVKTLGKITTLNRKGEIDVIAFCGDSKNDCPKMIPDVLTRGVSVVDCYDEHHMMISKDPEIKSYPQMLHDAAIIGGATANYGAGWDPGLFSLNRVLNKSILKGQSATLYGGEATPDLTQPVDLMIGGLSQGHSSAIKKIPGVIEAAQYSYTRTDTLEKVRRGEKAESNDCHRRECFVVAEPGKEQYIEDTIRNMPGKFAGQAVNVTFMSMEQFIAQGFDKRRSHGGRQFFRNDNANVEYNLQMKSNPEMTASVMLATCIANQRMNKKGLKGSFSFVETIPYLLSKDEIDELM